MQKIRVGRPVPDPFLFKLYEVKGSGQHSLVSIYFDSANLGHNKNKLHKILKY